MKKSILIVLTLLFTSFYSIAQKGILLYKKDSTKVKILLENTRIKVKLLDGEVLSGKFIVIDKKSIMLDNITINLDDIVRIRSNSIAKQILNPISLSFGALSLYGAAVGAVEGGLAIIATYALLPLAIPLLAIPLSQNNHVSTKWTYKIFDNEASILEKEKDKKPIKNTNP